MSEDIDPVIRRLRASASDVGDGVAVDAVARGVRARREARRRAAGALLVVAVVAPVSWAILTHGGGSTSTAIPANAPHRESERMAAPEDASKSGAIPEPQVAAGGDCPQQLPGSDTSWVPVGSARSASRLVPTTTPAAATLCIYAGLAGGPGTLVRSTQITIGLSAIPTDLNALPIGSPRPCPALPLGAAEPPRYLVHLRYADGSDAWVRVSDACGGFTTNGSTIAWATPTAQVQNVLSTGRWR